MVFITTGQRIATENFEEGKLYKVVLRNGNTVYFMCTGIGTDFVMLQSDEPRLFALTMQSAAQVSTIDLYDPTPPAPPTPIPNCLQYQTGAPPFNFRTTDNKLFSWYIKGPAGDKTANSFDKDRTQGIINNAYINQSGEQVASQNYYLSYPLEVLENSVYTWSFVTGTTSYHSAPTVAFYDENDVLLSVATHSSNVKHFTFTTPLNTKYIRGSVYRGQSQNTTMFLEGSTELPDTTSMDYIPYGYKIPILTNNHKATIYLDAPLSENEKLYSVNVDTEIITDIGDNNLSITSETQPPEMQIVYGIYAEA